MFGILSALISEIPELREAIDDAIDDRMNYLMHQIDVWKFYDKHDNMIAWKQNEIDRYREWQRQRYVWIDTNGITPGWMRCRYQRQATTVRFSVGRSKK